MRFIKSGSVVAALVIAVSFGSASPVAVADAAHSEPVVYTVSGSAGLTA